jgi:glycosyltransferase involved in cell wall biosynthesis
MKVAMIGWEFPPFMAGGLGIHCLGLTTHLARRGVEIDFYMPHMQSVEGPLRVAPQYKHLKITEVEADPISPYGRGAARYDENFNEAVAVYNKRVVAAFRSHDAQVLHAHDWITIPAALELRKKTGLPLVLTIHSTEHDRSAGFYPQTWIEDVERRGVLQADRVITVSQYTKDQIVQNYGVEPGKVSAIHNGVEMHEYAHAQDRDYGRQTKRVLFLSRLSRQKGPMYFMRAAQRVLECEPNTKFLVVGKGEMLGECVEYALGHGIHHRVEFAGFVPDKERAAYFDASDVYVLPSVSEPFGISIVEAMASGLPTIVSKTTGVGEALTHVLKADYWDSDEMADLILRLLRSAALREELGRNGALNVRKFTWSACADRTLDVYKATQRVTVAA